MMTIDPKTAKFESKNTVNVRCGGHGAEAVGAVLPVKAKSGRLHTVCLAKLIEDYGDDDVAVFEIEYL